MTMRRLYIALLAGAVMASAAPAGAQESTNVLARERVLRDPAAPVIGNAKAEFTIVEFFDYQCPACRQVRPVLEQVVREDGKVRVVLKDWPVFGKVSQAAARLALATKVQGKYEAAHIALLGAKSRLTDQTMRDLLASAGIDVPRALADLETHGGEIDALLARNDAQANAFGFPGTPSFIIGTFRVPGVPTAAAFKQAIKDARAAAAKR
jgi:protein-disulfide isomerase